MSNPMTDHGAAGFCTDHHAPADRPTTVALADYEAACRNQRAAEAERDALAATVARVEHIVDRYGSAHDAKGCAVLHDLRVLLAARPDAPGLTVTREAVEAAWAAWFPSTSGPWSTNFRWRLYKTLADLGLTVTDTPTEGGRGLRPLPRERYDAVLDSGPTEGGAR